MVKAGMRAMIGFTMCLLAMPAHWRMWVGLLIAVNFGLPWFFIATLEAKLVLAAFVVGALAQMVIFGAKGFVRLLGLGHAPWLFLVPWLWMRLDQASDTEGMRFWLLSVIVVNGLSLAIDITDVIRYARGNREEIVEGRGRASP